MELVEENKEEIKDIIDVSEDIPKIIEASSAQVPEKTKQNNSPRTVDECKELGIPTILKEDEHNEDFQKIRKNLFSFKFCTFIHSYFKMH